MGPSLSAIIGDIFRSGPLEFDSEEVNCWFQYVDDIFIVWSHGKVTFQTFLEHLAEQNTSTNFSMKSDLSNSLHFLDVCGVYFSSFNIWHRLNFWITCKFVKVFRNFINLFLIMFCQDLNHITAKRAAKFSNLIW